MPRSSIPNKLRWSHLPECEAPAAGWRVGQFTEIARVVAGQSPPSETYNDNGLGLPFLQGNADFSSKYPKAATWCSAPAKIASKGDILISVRAPVGEINRADRQYAIGRGLAAIQAVAADSDFIYHALQRWRWSLQRVAQGTTFDAVTARHFAQLVVAFPDDVREQTAIARVLDAVDSAISKARQLGERTGTLMRSLMQEFLPEWLGFRRLEPRHAGNAVTRVDLAGNVCSIRNGSTPSRSEGRYWRTGP